MKENNENFELDIEGAPKPEMPSQIPKPASLNVSEKVKKEVNDSIWDRLHPGDNEVNNFNMPERAD
jgi:hypothetical protein